MFQSQDPLATMSLLKVSLKVRIEQSNSL